MTKLKNLTARLCAGVSLLSTQAYPSTIKVVNKTGHDLEVNYVPASVKTHSRELDHSSCPKHPYGRHAVLAGRWWPRPSSYVVVQNVEDADIIEWRDAKTGQHGMWRVVRIHDDHSTKRRPVVIKVDKDLVPVLPDNSSLLLERVSDIRQAARYARERAGQLADEARDRTGRAVERTREKAHEVAEKAKEKAHEVAEKTRSTARSAKEKAKEVARKTKQKAKHLAEEMKHKED